MSSFAPTTPSAAARRREREGVLLALVAASSFAAMVVMAKLAYAAGAERRPRCWPAASRIAAVVLWMLAARAGVARALHAGATRSRHWRSGGLVLRHRARCSRSARSTRIDASLAELLLFAYPALVVLGAIALRHEPASRRRLGALGHRDRPGSRSCWRAPARAASDPLGIALALGAAVAVRRLRARDRRASAARLHGADRSSALVCSGAALALLRRRRASSGTLQLGA